MISTKNVLLFCGAGAATVSVHAFSRPLLRTRTGTFSAVSHRSESEEFPVHAEESEQYARTTIYVEGRKERREFHIPLSQQVHQRHRKEREHVFEGFALFPNCFSKEFLAPFLLSQLMSREPDRYQRLSNSLKY
jgi:hypothetical protein